MAWEILTDVDKAWIAGIFEGEGTIVVHQDKYIRICFYNNDISMLKEIKNMFGDYCYLHLHKHKRKEEWAISHQLQMQHKLIITFFIDEIVPFIRSDYKKEQIRKVIEKVLNNGGDYDFLG